MWPGLGSIAQHGVVERSIVVEIDGYHSAGRLHRVCLKKLALQGNSVWHCEQTFCLYPKTQAVFWKIGVFHTGTIGDRDEEREVGKTRIKKSETLAAVGAKMYDFYFVP